MRFKEDDLQMAVAKYLDSLKVLWVHVGNERKTSFQAGARLKAKGVKSGVPDVLIFDHKNNYSGLAIELKIKPNKPTQNQLAWLKRLKNVNWQTAIAYDFNEAKEIIDEYLK